MGPAGRIARTVSAFASISAEPPIVMVSVKDTSPLSLHIQKNGVFSLNILASDQHPVANLFGRSSPSLPGRCSVRRNGPITGPGGMYA
ncbi:flavin reductase family protein [Komagataeibacter rhaeticus]|nr:flavin reductase family protein [Komagataeibacter rhaeticus]